MARWASPKITAWQALATSGEVSRSRLPSSSPRNWSSWAAPWSMLAGAGREDQEEERGARPPEGHGPPAEVEQPETGVVPAQHQPDQAEDDRGHREPGHRGVEVGLVAGLLDPCVAEQGGRPEERRPAEGDRDP